VRIDSTNSLYFAHLGQVYFDLKRYDSSAAAYATAARLDEGNPVLLLNLGLARARAGDVKGAEAAFRESIASYQPEDVAKVYNQLGALYYTDGRYRGARKAYQSALTYQPGNLEAQFYLAVTLDRLELYTQARQWYQKFLKAAGSNPSFQEKSKLARKRASEIR
jgi:tetratricopeptide (TPR) repeat protein